MKKMIYVDVMVRKRLREMAHDTGQSVNDLIAGLCGMRGYSATGNDRKIAVAKGGKTYQGKPCRHKHSGERWTSTGACVTCSRIHTQIQSVPGEDPEWKRIRYLLREQGEKTYFSPVVCPACGGYERSVRFGACANCHPLGR